MLNPFPDLLAFGLLAPFFLRIALGVVFFDFARHALVKSRERHAALFESLGWGSGKRYAKALGSVELLLAALLVAGFYTQIAALAAFALSLAAYYLKGRQHGVHIEHRRHLFFLTAIIALSLLFSGAGAFAFDLPL